MELFRRLASTILRIPGVTRAEELRQSFTASGRLLFAGLSILLVVSTLALVFMVGREFIVKVPAPGGELVEGIIGTPRFVNPLLAISDADRDLVALVFSGLMRVSPDGAFIPDLAESYTISEDGRTYTFILRENATFQDGSPVTADDVLFTISKAQDPGLKSVKRANWDGVLVEKLSDREIQFTLKEAYAPFISNMTLGVLPKHLWKDVSAEEFPFSNLNVEPVGSGPYRVTHVGRNASGIPESYTLKPFRQFTLGAPYLSQITLTFYENEQRLADALRAGTVEAASGIAPDTLKGFDADTINRAPLNRVFGIFFNQNQSDVLRDASVRQALDMAIDREALVAGVFGGYATPIYEPLPPGVIAHLDRDDTVLGTSTDMIHAARGYLEGKGWTWDETQQVLVKKSGKTSLPLHFSITTANVPELRAAAEFVRASWTEMGASVDVEIYEQGDLNQNVIRPRKYDALLFGEIIGRELDLFAFWHSSQRNDPGLNIALYANSTADKALEALRVAQTGRERREIYESFRAEILKDTPAVFLYSPDFTYAFPNIIEGLDLSSIATPSERFLNVHAWHTESDRVWMFLVPWAK